MCQAPMRNIGRGPMRMGRGWSVDGGMPHVFSWPLSS